MTARDFWNCLTSWGKQNVLLKMGETAIPYSPESLAYDALPSRVQEALRVRWNFSE
jgi:hypothetical protein